MSAIEVTECHVHVLKNPPPPVGQEAPLLAFARVVLNGAFVVQGIRVIQGREGTFISFPRELDKKKNKMIDICYPIKQDLQAAISKRVLGEFDLKSTGRSS